jgi:hypothetical protein
MYIHLLLPWQVSSHAGCVIPARMLARSEPTLPRRRRPDGSRDALTGRGETFDGDGCRHHSHRAKVHDPDDRRIAIRQAQPEFTRVVEAFAADRQFGHDEGKGSGSGALKVNGTIFAMMSSKGE